MYLIGYIYIYDKAIPLLHFYSGQANIVKHFCVHYLQFKTSTEFF